MKHLKALIKAGLALALVAGPLAKSSAQTYTIDPGATWFGFVNVFNVGGPGYGMGGAGGYVFSSSWGTADLRATFAGPTLSLAANTVNDPDPFWYTPSGGPGALGNKIVDANFYQEFNGPLAGTTVTFTGNVLANTLATGPSGPTDAAGRGWTAVAFIKDFAPDYSSSVTVTAPLTPGVFSISLPTINNPLRHVQFGFQVIGPDVWAGDPLTFLSANIVAVPEPTSASLLLLGLASLGLLARNRKQ